MTDTPSKVVDMVEKAIEPLVSRTLFWPELIRLQRPEYLIKKVLDKGAFAQIFGPSGSGKSFFACDLGLHVAAGWDWRGCKVRQSRLG